jgi:hypothetical protein
VSLPAAEAEAGSEETGSVVGGGSMKPESRPTCCICRKVVPPGVRWFDVQQGAICQPCQDAEVQRRTDEMRRMQAERAESRL